MTAGNWFFVLLLPRYRKRPACGNVMLTSSIILTKPLFRNNRVHCCINIRNHFQQNLHQPDCYACNQSFVVSQPDSIILSDDYLAAKKRFLVLFEFAEAAFLNEFNSHSRLLSSMLPSINAISCLDVYD